MFVVYMARDNGKGKRIASGGKGKKKENPMAKKVALLPGLLYELRLQLRLVVRVHQVVQISQEGIGPGDIHGDMRVKIHRKNRNEWIFTVDSKFLNILNYCLIKFCFI